MRSAAEAHSRGHGRKCARRRAVSTSAAPVSADITALLVVAVIALLSGERREGQMCAAALAGRGGCLWDVLSRRRSPRPWKQRASARQVGDRPLALPKRFRFALTRLALTVTGGGRSPRRGLGRPRAGQFERNAILSSDVLWVARWEQPRRPCALTRGTAGRSQPRKMNAECLHRPKPAATQEFASTTSGREVWSAEPRGAAGSRGEQHQSSWTWYGLFNVIRSRTETDCSSHAAAVGLGVGGRGKYSASRSAAPARTKRPLGDALARA